MRWAYRMGSLRRGALISFQRLSTKSNLKLAKLWLDRKEYDRLQPVCPVLLSRDFANLQILRSLHAACEPGAGASSDDQTRGSLCGLILASASSKLTFQYLSYTRSRSRCTAT